MPGGGTATKSIHMVDIVVNVFRIVRRTVDLVPHHLGTDGETHA